MSERSDSMADAIEKHADLILRASGSGLRHYTMQKTRAAILMAVADCFEEAYRAGAEFGRAQNALMREALEAAKRAIGDHFAPNDCYVTGPLTGDVIRDLVQCPACSFIAMHDDVLASNALAQVAK